MKFLVPLSARLLERGLLPDVVLRKGIRALLRRKLLDESKDGIEAGQARLMRFIDHMYASPIAIHTREANQQHYELPTKFFEYCLGRHLKYSSCYFRRGHETLDQAEEDMLAITCERADISGQQHILELGCGWGSLSLFIAARFPNTRITAVSNSRTQKIFIDEEARKRGVRNLNVITCDMNAFSTQEKFDRIVSVEMFEHMQGWPGLLEKAASFLKSDGKLFIHIFTHRQFAYPYDALDEGDFIGRHFFTGGIMPSDNLLLYFQEHFLLQDHWQVSGRHYAKTAECWLKNMDARKSDIMPILRNTYGIKDAVKWWHYWRVFYISCAELWGYKNGTEWIVSHYRFNKR